MNGDQTTNSELSESAWIALCLKHAAAGSELDLTRDGAGDNPAQADGWHSGREIPATAVRAALLELQRNADTADPRGLRIRGADIKGRLDLDYLKVPCPLHLIDCRLITGVSLRCMRLPELSFARSQLTSSDQSVPSLNGLGVTINGQLSLRGATLTNEGGGIALQLDGATIDGGAFLDKELTATGESRALRATIKGPLILRGATLTNHGGTALHLDGATIDGGVFLDKGFTATGEIRAPGATITGQLTLRRATLTNNGGNALDLDGATIVGDAFLDDGLTATGELRALGARITGQLALSGATLTNHRGSSLNLDGATIGGGVFLDDGLTADGEIRALGAMITGPLILRGATLNSENGIAVGLDGATIGGGVFLDDGFTANGEIRALGARITGQLDLSGANLTNHGGNALGLAGAQVTRLRFQGLNKVDGLVDLTSCEIGDLYLDHSKAAFVPPGELVAHGWRVRALHGAIATDASVALRWLDTRPAELPYSPQPARELADVYDRTGHPDQARKLRRKTAWKVAKNAPRRSKLGHYLYGVVVGHGYSPMRPLAWIASLFLVAWLLAFIGRSFFIPTEPAKAQAAVAAAASGTQTSPAPGLSAPPIPNGATSCDELGGYPCFIPWTYAMQTVVPPAAAIQATSWQPASWMMLPITALKACGWILVSLLLAGATGLLRRA